MCCDCSDILSAHEIWVTAPNSNRHFGDIQRSNFGPCYCYGRGMRWSRVSKCLMMASDSATLLCLCLNYTAGWGPGRLRLIRCRPRLRFRGGGSRALRWSVCRQQSDGLHGWTRCWLCCGLCRAWHVPVWHLETFFSMHANVFLRAIMACRCVNTANK